uniref:WAP four-disulfide core domain protein 8-like isoform X2 n=1 Tax=Phascolarctos cinereus TaxID=38626 RepID=A0A6P5IAV0_PHACI|nr:WAP four-disulfide core domain protein 8-like isoform X2 [Phascolarctos cinereus]
MFFWLLRTMTVGTWGNRAKSPSFTWIWRSIITIFLILILPLELMSNLSFKRASSQCHTDFNCKHSMKCCHYSCGKKCLDPKADVCTLSPEVGDCDDFHLRWFYSMEARTCEHFFYSGCNGNVNNFPNKKICEQTCGGTVRKGFCPPFPFKGISNCSAPCRKDPECPKTYKCCDSSCGLVCTPPWKVKPWDCPPQPSFCKAIQKPLCQSDGDCENNEKCCSNCGLKCIKNPRK